MGEFPKTELRVGLDIQVSSVEETEKYFRLKLTYVPEPGDRVPAYLLIPKKIEQPAAAMLCLHPTHFELGKAQLCGLGGRPSQFYAHELAELGLSAWYQITQVLRTINTISLNMPIVMQAER